MRGATTPAPTNGRSHRDYASAGAPAPTQAQEIETISGLLGETEALTNEIGMIANEIANRVGGSTEPAGSGGATPVPSDVRSELSNHRYHLRTILEDLQRASRALQG